MGFDIRTAVLMLLVGFVSGAAAGVTVRWINSKLVLGLIVAAGFVGLYFVIKYIDINMPIEISRYRSSGELVSVWIALAAWAAQMTSMMAIASAFPKLIAKSTKTDDHV